jgi:hypothetical protein
VAALTPLEQARRQFFPHKHSIFCDVRRRYSHNVSASDGFFAGEIT